MGSEDFAVGQNLETPVSDRGVVTPLPRIEVVIDWFQATIMSLPFDNPEEQVLDKLFHVTKEACIHMESGLYGYNNTYVYAEKIKVLWHSNRPEMGVHIQLSGVGCRVLEDLITWKEFFNRMASFQNWKPTRIDIAIDTYEKHFTVQQLKEKIVNEELVSKFRKSTYMEQLNISDGTSESASITFGSSSSDLYIVFYDKLAERKNAGYEVSLNIDFWLRTELRFKGDLSRELIKLIFLNDYVVGDFIQEILYNYIDFKVKSDDSHKHRWLTCDWWLKFLGVTSKLSIAPKASDSTITRKKNYAENILSKMFAMVRITDNDFYTDLFRKGFDKISKSDLDIINAHYLATGHEIITMDQLHDIYNNINSVERESYMADYKAKEVVRQIRVKALGTEYETFE